MTRRRISIITPCFNEDDNVEACYKATLAVMEGQLPTYDYEHIFADNASSDNTFAVLCDLAQRDKRVKVIRNSRNVGPFRNTFHALKYARGDAVLVMLAADLQDPPELIPKFVALWEQGYAIVYGVRKERDEPFWLRTCRRIYYRLVDRMSGIHIPLDAGEFQLVDRVVLQSLCKVDDYYPYIRGLIAQTGLRAVGVPYTWRQRHSGVSKNNLLRLIDQALNGIISTSKTPIRICTFIGVLVAVFSFGYALVQLVWNIIMPHAPMGVPTIIVTQFFFNGLMLFFFGILGEYVSAIHDQIRRGPPMIPLDLINFDPAELAEAHRAVSQPVATPNAT